MKINCAHSDILDIDTLVSHPRNPNKHTEKQIKLLAKIMKHQGWRHPVTVSKRSGFVIAGHGRIEAARLNGWEQVPVDKQEFASEADEYAHLIADNKIAELADLDLQMVDEDVIKLGEDFDLDLLGIPFFQLGTSDDNDPDKHWKGMPEFDQPDATSYRHVVVHFRTPQDVAQFFTLIGQNNTGGTKSIWHPFREHDDLEANRYEVE